MVLSLLIAACAAAGVEAPQWDGPAWADPAQPYVVSLHTDAANLRCAYAYADGPNGEAAMERVSPDEAAFTIPPAGGDAASLTLRVEAGGAVLAERTIPVAKRYDFDVTGDAAIPLPYPLIPGYVRAEFIPCCTIYGGELTAYTLDANPEPTAEGLPEFHDGRFVILAPDDLVVTTSGLNVVFAYGDAPEPGLAPAVFSFNKTAGAWQAISNPKRNDAKSTLTVDCPGGGMFVLGWTAE